MPPQADGFAARLVRGPALRTQPDRRLVTLVREGYEVAFEEIVRRYGKPLTRYAAAIVGSRGEDVTQDAFSKALLALRRDDDTEIELRPWLFRIVRNTALNDLRDSPPTPELLAEALASGANPAEEAERREELADLMHRLRSLPDRQRAAIVMRELEGLSHEEIANALGLSGGAARQAIFRARQTLRDGLGMLLPLPLLRLLVDHGGEIAVAGAGSGGAAAASGALGGAGAGVALKAATATVLVAGALGAGVAVQHARHSDRVQAAPEPAAQSLAGTSDSSGGSTTAAAPAGGGARSGQADDHGGSDRRGESEPGDDRGGDRADGARRDEHSGDDDHRSPDRGADHGDDDHSGPSRDDHSGEDDHPGGGQGSGRSDAGGGQGSGGGDGGGHGSSPSSGHSGHGGGGGREDGSASIDEPIEGGTSGPAPSGDSASSGNSGSGLDSGSEPGFAGDSSGDSGSGGHGGDDGSGGDGSGPGTSGGGFGAAEQLP